ncbi:tetratricopeptide repeat protein [Acidisoma silvae]|uniref:Tetratricopeptide repeat protein n=1 Tax=Acidisoma silvae TaxID=2802396 RepID=A0A963YWE8_9PROT|nr:tetratricopeptide repeat protein [Acidisoma silvae]MCB8878452.1 tetratricopeptide repeat protein [Acidisoma silvae]
MLDVVRADQVSGLREALDSSCVLLIKGRHGFAPKATVTLASHGLADWHVLSEDGNWTRSGYLGGFHDLIDEMLSWCHDHALEMITQYEQTLKRLFPLKDLPEFLVPKDLTNTSTKEERTRFYHHEYQNKLLVGLAEFLFESLQKREMPTVLIIEDASGISPTVNSLIRVLMRLQKHKDVYALKIVLLDYHSTLLLDGAVEFVFPKFSRVEMQAALDPVGNIAPEKLDRIYATSGGDLAIAEAVLLCDKNGIPVAGYLDAGSIADLYLSSLPSFERKSMTEEFIRNGCPHWEWLSQRNYALSGPDELDAAHRLHHLECMRAYWSGTSPLILCHGMAMSNKFERMEFLAEPCEILKSIGLYDTWFSFFSPLFADPDLRHHGSGNDDVNAVFINAAFVLYSLGCGSISVPYLEDFHKTFPESKYTPTVLYAQSMTYGRYQQPVNLPLAEQYAQRNLETIEKSFQGYEKYHYIRVFAENAYAYIKARQGKYAEALELCTNGNRKMLDIYGDGRFRLHQSILIYNTSQVYEIVKDYAKAEQQLRLAISYDPYYGEYYNDLGNLLSKMEGRESEALTAYERAIALCPPYYEAHLNRGGLHRRLGNNALALADFQRASEIKPSEARAWFEIGTMFLADGEPVKALSAYRKAAEIDRGNADLFVNMGLACSELGQVEESISFYKKALSLQPKNALAHNNIAIELFSSGEKDAALNHAILASQMDDDPEIQATRRFIEGARSAAEFSSLTN